MSGNVTVALTNRENAERAWGADMPAWVGILADACDRTNQRAVAERIGKSSGYVSRVVRRTYAGSYAEAEQIVRAALSPERVMCPLYGDMALKTCITNRRRPRPANWLHVQFAKACPDCPNNTDRPDEEE